MRYVGLARGRDYSGRGVKAYRGEPLLVPENKAAELVGSGFFRYLDAGMAPDGAEVLGVQNLPEGIGRAGGVLADGAEAPEEAVPGIDAMQTAPGFPYKKSEIERMKTAELEACAMGHGIDISGCRTNAERVSIILAVLQQDSDASKDSPARSGRVPQDNAAALAGSDAVPGGGALPDSREGAVG